MIPFVLVSCSHLPVFYTEFAASNFCLDEDFADAYVAWTAQAADHRGTLESQKVGLNFRELVLIFCLHFTWSQGIWQRF